MIHGAKIGDRVKVVWNDTGKWNGFREILEAVNGKEATITGVRLDGIQRHYKSITFRLDTGEVYELPDSYLNHV